jgi:heme exporter protein D|tara:strand:- start:305 stop:478 length:174 start_codon:yes stop_codon:yes gene_type:complete
MYFNNLAELWEMAGHGPYVWSAYAISFIVLAAIVVIPAKRYRQQLAQIQQQSNKQDK